MDVEIEGYLYKPEKADYLNINQSGSDGEFNLDTECEIVHNPHDERVKQKTNAIVVKNCCLKNTDWFTNKTGIWFTHP